MSKTLTQYLLIVFSFFLIGCGDKKQSVENDNSQVQTSEKVAKQRFVSPLREVVEAKDSTIVKPAFLSQNLPETAFAYARIPNFWSFIGSAKGNVFDKAFKAEPFVGAIQSIQEGFNENVIPDIPDENAQLIAKLLLNRITSPIELIVLEGVDPAIPTPNILLTMNVNFTSTSEIQEVLQSLNNVEPKIEITKSVQDDGYAELNIVKMSTQLQWDKTHSRLSMLSGVSLSPNNLADLMKSLVPNPNHQMKALEVSIDTSGQGLFAWANPRKLSSIGSSLGMQREVASLAVVGISSMKNIAVGAGTSEGINRLKYLVEMPVTGFRSYMPIINSTPSFNLAGKTKMVGVFGLPSRADFTSIENTIALVTKPKDMKSYYKLKKEFKNALGFEFDELFDFFGQDISLISDQAGSYAAIRLNDADKFKQTLKNSVESLGLEYKQREIGGHTYHHLKIPSIYSKSLEESSKNKSRPGDKLLKRFFGIPSHVYWEEEGDYLMLSNIPQTLMDRHYIKEQTSVNQWLEQQQRMKPDGSLMMVSIRNQGTAEKMYRMHLNAINTAADFVGKPIDLFELATPHEAKIPKESTYGFKITSSQTQLAFELNYENNPFEFILSGGVYESMAVVGVLSAIAVPAYDDYRMRSKISMGINDVQEVKARLNEFEIEYGRYPNQYEIEDLGLNSSKLDYAISVVENKGEIELKFAHSALRTRNMLRLLPPKQGVSTIWQCKSRMKRKYLPSSLRCRY